MKRTWLFVLWVAFAACPATVSANTAQLTSSGTVVTVGTSLKGTAGTVLFADGSGSSLWSCSSASLVGSVAKNNGSEVEITVESASFVGTGAGSQCTAGFPLGNQTVTAAVEKGLPWCLKSTASMAADEITLRGGKCSEAARQINFTFDSGLGECKYKQENLISGHFTTGLSSEVSVKPELIKESGSFCTTPTTVSLSFSLEKNESGNPAVYFSTPPPNTPELTYPTGTRLATESKVKAHNVGELKLTPTSGTFGCSTAEMTGTLTKNTGNEIEVNAEATNLSGTGSLSDCTSSLGNFRLTTNVANGLPWCLRAVPTLENDEFQLRGGKCSEAARPIKFTMDITGTSECTYERSAAITGTFTTHPAEATFTISGPEFTKTAGPETCPVGPKLDWTFTLERDEEGTHPAYIS